MKRIELDNDDLVAEIESVWGSIWSYERRTHPAVRDRDYIKRLGSRLANLERELHERGIYDDVVNRLGPIKIGG